MALLSGLVEASIQSAFFVAIVLGVRRALKDRVPPSVYCLAWTVVAARLLYPWGIELPFWGWTPRGRVGVAFADVDASAMAPSVVDAGQGPSSLTVGLVSVWLFGVLLLSVIRAGRLHVFARRVADARPATAVSLLSAWSRVLAASGATRPPALRVSGGVDSPALVGVLRPRVLVPARLERELSSAHWHALLMHELAHHRRWDVLRTLLLEVACIVHWPNPMVWLALRANRCDREVAADSHAIARLGDGHVFGEALLSALALGAVASSASEGASALSASSELARRLRIAGRNDPKRIVGRLGVAGVALTSAVAFASPSPPNLAPNGDLEGGASVDGVPRHWLLSGVDADQYRVTLDPRERHAGEFSARLEARSEPGRYATLMQHLPANAYRNKRIRVRAHVRARDVTSRGDFWARVQGADSPADGPGLGAGKCALSGTTSWSPCVIELHVPADAAYLQFGLGLGQGGGVAWVDDVTIVVAP